MAEGEEGFSRWMLLAAAVLSMMLIGLYQYSWTLFIRPLKAEFNWSLDTIQLTFTLFVWIMTWTQPLAGLIADKRGPRLLALLGGLMAGLGWMITSLIDTPEILYMVYGLGSIGVGVIYATSIGLASKWFPDRRGLANGFTSFGYGFGAAVLNPVISWIIGFRGFRAAFTYMGAVMLLALSALGLLVRYPISDSLRREGSSPLPSPVKEIKKPRGFGAKEMVKTGAWWHIYPAFLLTASTGLMVTSQLTPMGEAFKLSESVILTATVAFPIVNGLGRILGGWVSDQLGREVTMTIFFSSQGISSIMLLLIGSNEIAFVAIICLIALFWGPIFTFFPSIIADYYGRENSTANYGLTYTAKAWGGLFGGYVVAWLVMTYESFNTPIILSIIFGFTSALLVFPKFLKKPIQKTKA